MNPKITKGMKDCLIKNIAIQEMKENEAVSEHMNIFLDKVDELRKMGVNR